MRNLNIVRFARRIRTYLFLLLRPFDSLFLRINGLTKYPPINLRRHVGFLGSSFHTGERYRVFMMLQMNLKSDTKILDLGCGWGLLALALNRDIDNGYFTGVDIHKPSIQWANKHISSKKTNFKFIHADVKDEIYCPNGSLSEEEFFRTFSENGFDIIVAKSLFTHLLPSNCELYLREVGSRLATTGYALVSFFLLNDVQLEFQERNKNDIQLHPQEDGYYAVKYVESPSSAVAYDEKYVSNLVNRSGMKIKTIFYGSWSGRKNTIDYQDLLILTKESEKTN